MKKVLEKVFSTTNKMFCININVLELEYNINKRKFFEKIKTYLENKLVSFKCAVLMSSNKLSLWVMTRKNESTDLFGESGISNIDSVFLEIMKSCLVECSDKAKEYVKENFALMLLINLQGFDEIEQLSSAAFDMIESNKDLAIWKMLIEGEYILQK